jgi:hypothetical protein
MAALKAGRSSGSTLIDAGVVEELPNETLDLGVGAELVGVHHAAGQDDGVVIVGVRVSDGHVDVDLVAPRGALPALHLRALLLR